jgi:hypothetical protein
MLSRVIDVGNRRRHAVDDALQALLTTPDAGAGGRPRAQDDPRCHGDDDQRRELADEGEQGGFLGGDQVRRQQPAHRRPVQRNEQHDVDGEGSQQHARAAEGAQRRQQRDQPGHRRRHDAAGGKGPDGDIGAAEQVGEQEDFGRPRHEADGDRSADRRHDRDRKERQFERARPAAHDDEGDEQQRHHGRDDQQRAGDDPRPCRDAGVGTRRHEPVDDAPAAHAAVSASHWRCHRCGATARAPGGCRGSGMRSSIGAAIRAGQPAIRRRRSRPWEPAARRSSGLRVRGVPKVM